MYREITLQTLGHILTLRNNTHASRQILQDFRHKQRVVGTPQNDGINLRVLMHNLVDALLHEIVGTRRIGLVILHQRHPEGTSHTAHLYIREQLLYLQIVALALDGSFGSQHTHMARLRQLADDLSCRTNHAQDAAIGVPLWQVYLLDATQGFGGGSVTTQYDKVTPHLKEAQHSLTGELVNDFERTGTVGCTGIIAEVQVVVLGQQLAYAVQNGQSAVAAIENADGSRLTGERHEQAG